MVVAPPCSRPVASAIAIAAAVSAAKAVLVTVAAGMRRGIYCCWVAVVFTVTAVSVVGVLAAAVSAGRRCHAVVTRIAFGGTASAGCALPSWRRTTRCLTWMTAGRLAILRFGFVKGYIF